MYQALEETPVRTGIISWPRFTFWHRFRTLYRAINNPFQTIGSSIGIGLLIGHNGFLAAKLGIHFRRTIGLAMLIPIVPIYGATGASLLTTLPVPEGAKAVATIPLLLVPAAFAYQEEIKELRMHGKKLLTRLRAYNRIRQEI